MVAKDESNGDPASPPESSFSELMRQLCQTRWQIAMVVTGGGTGAIAKCLRRSGASINFIEAFVPYSHASVIDYLGEPLRAGHADLSTAMQLASVAMRRAGELGSGKAGDAVGIALVAALPTEPPRDHVDRIHVAIETANDAKTWSRELTDRAYIREEAEAIADALVFAAIAFLMD